MSDLISRSALIEEIERQKLGLSGNSELAYNLTLRIADIFCNIISKQPTVEANSVVKGEWIKRDTILKEYYKCSLCGNAEDYRKNFCSSCGSDMRGGKNE